MEQIIGEILGGSAALGLAAVLFYREINKIKSELAANEQKDNQLRLQVTTNENNLKALKDAFEKYEEHQRDQYKELKSWLQDEFKELRKMIRGEG